jgi:ribosomal protein L7/L12
VVAGYLKVKRTVDMPMVSAHCPYCGGATEFPEYPTEDYTCEKCHRRVYFENGKMVEAKDVECTVCKAVHKVAVTAKSYTCDRCNRTLRLDDPTKGVVATAETTVGQAFDVVLTEVGRNTTGVAMALQNVLVCNLPEARRQMQDLPLTIVKGVPERKADAVRSRFRELGATAVVRAVETESVPRT